MNAARPSSIPPPPFLHHLSPSLLTTSALFRPHRRRRSSRLRRPPDLSSPPPSLSDPNIDLSIDLDSIQNRLSITLSSLNHRLRRFVAAGNEAFNDLSTSVHVGTGHRLYFSCRRSSLVFVADLLVYGMLLVVGFRAVAWMVSGRGSDATLPVVRRRDRSLGGREVVIGRREVDGARGYEVKERERVGRRRTVRKEELPRWWSEKTEEAVVKVGKEEYQVEADKLVRAIMDSRMRGEDFRDDDIIQLRRVCRISGAKVSFGTRNACISFYRAAVDLVLHSCCRLIQPSATVLVDGEEARQFICGLADNIGLESLHAARLVRAAVAARTRASLLQSWALEVQGRRVEALEELSKIHHIYLIFPPEECSPEMEMVAGGLKKNLGVEQREHLLDMFKGIGGADIQKIAAEALGLVNQDDLLEVGNASTLL